MKPKLYFSKHADCQVCTETTQLGFKYVERMKGEEYVAKVANAYTIVFFLEGKALVTCNEFKDVPFHEGQMALWPLHVKCEWKSVTNVSCIILFGDNDLTICDRKIIKEHADLWLEVVPTFRPLTIRLRLAEFLHGVKNYLDDGITCPYMHKLKQRELSTILRAYYSPDELVSFFLPTVRNNHDFEWFIMDNYLKMKGVKEFVDLSGMNLRTFNRKFKAHFKESPYQWIIKQRAKHIHYELTSTNKSFSSIAKEFHFSDASHFNRYCKSMYGDSPSKIRRGVLITSD